MGVYICDKGTVVLTPGSQASDGIECKFCGTLLPVGSTVNVVESTELGVGETRFYCLEYYPGCFGRFNMQHDVAKQVLRMLLSPEGGD